METLERKKRILIVEDEKNIAQVLKYNIEKSGYEAEVAYDGGQGLQRAVSGEFDLVLLDIMLPVMNGFDVCAHVRRVSQVPIIFVTAREEEKDKIFGLDTGADDYVTKPFNPSELMARVKSQLRRYTTLGSIGRQNGEIVIGGLCISTESRTVRVDGDPVRLTPVEYKILELLARNRGRVFSAEDIYSNVWNEQNAVGDGTIAVHVRHIREKIEINPKEPRYLKVVWGIGYKIE